MRNVLFIMVDEFQANALSCLNHPVVQTPNIDKLARRGMMFTNAYTPSPICVPARACVATGRYTHQCGYWDNAIAYDGRVPGWGHALQEAGIPVTSIGKLHYRNAGDPTGFDQQILPMHIFKGIGQVWGSVRNPMPETTRPGGMLGNIGPGLSDYNAYDLSVAGAAQTWLRDQAVRHERWAAFVSFVAPHFPLTVPREYLDLYPAEEMPLPAVRPGVNYDRHPWLQRLNGLMDTDIEFASDGERQQAIAAYYGLCTFVDAQVGKVLDALEASGQAGSTLVIFTSDHGECLGMRGRWGKSVLYRESTHIPMILAGQGVGARKRIETPVSLIDIAPTITDVFDIAGHPEWPGTSLLHLAASDPDPSRLVFSEYHAVGSPSGGFMLADARWKYHCYVGYPPELFDLADDPLETTNLAADPAHAATLRRMHGALLKICDPDEVDRAAKADQDALVAKFGSPERAFQMGAPGATPVPTTNTQTSR